MKYLKKFKHIKESFMPSMDMNVINDILDRGEFTDDDKAYLDNYNKKNAIVIDLLKKLKGLTAEITEVNDKIKKIYSVTHPAQAHSDTQSYKLDEVELEKQRDKWMELSRQITEIEGSLRYVYKFEDVRYLRKLEYDLGLDDHNPFDYA